MFVEQLLGNSWCPCIFVLTEFETSLRSWLHFIFSFGFRSSLLPEEMIFEELMEFGGLEIALSLWLGFGLVGFDSVIVRFCGVIDRLAKMGRVSFD